MVERCLPFSPSAVRYKNPPGVGSPAHEMAEAYANHVLAGTLDVVALYSLATTVS